MEIKYGFALDVGSQESNSNDSVLGNLSAQMLISKGKKKASRGIISKMAKTQLMKTSTLYKNLVDSGMKLTPQEFQRLKKSPARLKSMLQMVQSHRIYQSEAAMNPEVNRANRHDGTVYGSMGLTHQTINDPRLRILTEICRRLQVARID